MDANKSTFPHIRGSTYTKHTDLALLVLVPHVVHSLIVAKQRPENLLHRLDSEGMKVGCGRDPWMWTAGADVDIKIGYCRLGDPRNVFFHHLGRA